MKFADFVSRDAIKADLAADDKQSVIREMVQALLGASKIAPEEFEDGDLFMTLGKLARALQAQSSELLLLVDEADTFLAESDDLRRFRMRVWRKPHCTAVSGERIGADSRAQDVLRSGASAESRSYEFTGRNGSSV